MANRRLFPMIGFILLLGMTPKTNQCPDSINQTAKKKLTTTIQVSIDSGGNLTCDEPTVDRSSEVTWQLLVPGTITQITQGDAFTATPTYSHGQWSATTVSTDGTYTYSITVQLPNGQYKQKSPKITMSPPSPLY
jgi:hypothetical protein